MKKALAAVPVLVALMLTGCGGPSGEEVALEACRDGILDQLDSPTSASFTEFEATDLAEAFAVLASEEPKEREPGEPVFYTVTGNVDSDNPMGVSIRNSILCTVDVMDGEAVEVSADLI